MVEILSPNHFVWDFVSAGAYETIFVGSCAHDGTLAYKKKKKKPDPLEKNVKFNKQQ
jgi:hypothetical protein